MALVTYIDNFSGSIAVSPSGIYLYASHAFSDNITAYTIGVDGSITELKGSPFPSNSSGAGSETVALAIAPSGKFIFTLQVGSAVTVCSSRINADGSLSLVGCTPSIGSDLPYGGFLAIDRTSNYLYAPNYERTR